jgi:tetratricopeptide (TPR) repeat protein
MANRLYHENAKAFLRNNDAIYFCHSRLPGILLNITIILVVSLIFSAYSFADNSGRKDYWLNKYGEVRKGSLVSRAQEVFNRVLAAADRRVGIEPALYIINYGGTPWAQSLADGSVMLTKNALEFCYKSKNPEKGDERLAFVIGHELAHQFNGDFWHYKFLSTAQKDKEGQLAFQDIKELAKNPDNLLSKEIQADQYGIIYAALAGYRADEIISKDHNFFLEWLQKSDPSLYSSKGIISLSEKRARAVTMRLKEVSDRTILFQLGVISYYIGRYDDALNLFERFASYFPGREVYTNIGTIYLQIAYEKYLQSRTPESFPYSLSFGIDIRTRADSMPVARGFSEDKFREYKKAVQTAIGYLKKATEYDPFYREARNNLGCSYIIDSKYYDAVSMLEEGLKLSPGNKGIQNNLAIAYIMLGQELGSDNLLEKAEKILLSVKDGEPAARSNWNVLQRKKQRDNDVSSDTNQLDPFLHEAVIDFKPSLKLRYGETPRRNDLIILEEISTEGKELMKILKVQKNRIFILTKNEKVRLVLYKEPSRLNTDIKGGDGTVYMSTKGKNGIIVSRNKKQDYFEF